MLGESNESTILFWLVLLILLGLAGLYAVVLVRRWARSQDSGADVGGFTLSELRELHRRGQITAEEYEKARAQILAAGKSMTAGIDPLGRPSSSDRKEQPPPQAGDPKC